MAPRPSPAVYRRRRIVVLAALVLVVAVVVALVWFFVARAQDATPDPGPKSSTAPSAPTTEVPGTETPTPDAADTPAPTDGAAGPCKENNIRVAAVTDADTYEADASPQFSISLTNTGAADCTINVGTTTQVFTVKSGDDTWWRSTDCQQNPADMVVTLAAGSSVTSAEPVVWDRTRSSVDTCESQERPRAPGSGASYHLSVEIGGFASAESKQILLF